MRTTHRTIDGRKLVLKVIPDADLKGWIGQTVSLASRGIGPHWILKKFTGTQAFIETPASRRKDTVQINDLRQMVED